MHVKQQKINPYRTSTITSLKIGQGLFYMILTSNKAKCLNHLRFNSITLHKFSNYKQIQNINIKQQPSTKKVIYISMQTQQQTTIYKKLEKHLPNIFLPISNLLVVWYFILMVFLTVDFALTIIVICFNNVTSEIILYDYFNFILLIILIVDTLLSFNTGFLQRGKLILQRRACIINYIKSVYFYIDLWAIVWAFIQIVLRHVVQIQLPFIALLVYVKVFKVMNFNKLIKLYIIKSSTVLLIYELVVNVVLLAMVCHIFGSIFFLLDLKLIQLNWYTQDQLWVYSSYAYGNIIDQQFWVQYTYCFYFIIVTLSGIAYGDLVPLNPTEVAYAFMCVAVPIVVFAYLFSVIYSVVSSNRSQQSKISRSKIMIKRRLQNLGVNLKTKHKLLNFANYYFKNKIISQNAFISELAPSIKKQYRLEVLAKKYDFSIFKLLEWDNLLDKISNIIIEEVFTERFILFKKQFQLVYINQGQIGQFLTFRSKYSKSINHNNFVGAYYFFTNTKSPFKYQSKSFVVCQAVSIQSFQNLVKNNIKLKQTFSLLKDQMLLQQKLNQIKQKCFFCDSETHILAHCQHLRGDIPFLFIPQNQNKRTFYFDRNRKRLRKRIKSKKIHEIKYNKKQVDDNCQVFKEVSIQTDITNNYPIYFTIDKVFTWTKYYPHQNLIEI